jgi:hypothetical protein
VARWHSPQLPKRSYQWLGVDLDAVPLHKAL